MADLPFVDVPAAGGAQAAVIWLHGLGDSGHGFAPIVPELRLPAGHGIRFLFHMPRNNRSLSIMAW
jgi:phospholipase/carboxylesterase